uniref:Uncharacterized protein n=1 Tax=Helianthus annuus TaxID=4232 RepID=A0A251UGR6_HELAN
MPKRELNCEFGFGFGFDWVPNRIRIMNLIFAFSVLFLVPQMSLSNKPNNRLNSVWLDIF